MILYLAVTGDEYEFPLCITDSESDMAAWAGIKIASLRSSVCRNKGKPPFPHKSGRICKYRLRKIEVEEDENEAF